MEIAVPTNKAKCHFPTHHLCKLASVSRAHARIFNHSHFASGTSNCPQARSATMPKCSNLNQGVKQDLVALMVRPKQEMMARSSQTWEAPSVPGYSEIHMLSRYIRSLRPGDITACNMSGRQNGAPIVRTGHLRKEAMIYIVLLYKRGLMLHPISKAMYS